MHDIWKWIVDNPHPLLWSFVTALLTWFFKPRTPEQYAAMPPRLAAFLKLMGALGIDAPKTVEAVRELVVRSRSEKEKTHEK